MLLYSYGWSSGSGRSLHRIVRTSEKYEVNCPIYRESCGQLKQSSVMKTVVKVTNLIRGGNKSLSHHRKFRTFLEEMDATYGDLLLRSEVK